MNWDKIDIKNENLYVLIGNGRIILTMETCHLINNFDDYNYVEFYKTKINRVTYLGLLFVKDETPGSSKIVKGVNGSGAVINNALLIRNIYGAEGLASTYIKKSVLPDDDNPNMIVIHNNYSPVFEYGKDKKIRKKRIGTLLNDKWLIVSCCGHAPNGKKYPTYHIRNIEDGSEMDVSVRVVADVDKGLTTIDNIIMSHKVGVNRWRGLSARKKARAFKNIQRKKV